MTPLSRAGLPRRFCHVQLVHVHVNVDMLCTFYLENRATFSTPLVQQNMSTPCTLSRCYPLAARSAASLA